MAGIGFLIAMVGAASGILGVPYLLFKESALPTTEEAPQAAMRRASATRALTSRSFGGLLGMRQSLLRQRPASAANVNVCAAQEPFYGSDLLRNI